jgi:hypothetical protein
MYCIQTIDTMHNKQQAFPQLLEIRIIGSAGGFRSFTGRPPATDPHDQRAAGGTRPLDGGKRVAVFKARRRFQRTASFSTHGVVFNARRRFQRTPSFSTHGAPGDRSRQTHKRTFAGQTGAFCIDYNFMMDIRRRARGSYPAPCRRGRNRTPPVTARDGPGNKRHGGQKRHSAPKKRDRAGTAQE